MSALPEAAPAKFADADRRFGGLGRLYGLNGAQRIARSHVVVVGIGGVGSWAAEALARSGVGHITLVDMDHVSESNINRQAQALHGTLGQAKVLAMRDRIACINTDCVVTCVDDFVDADNWPGLLDEEPLSGVIDACDNIRAKTAMAAWARSNCTPVLVCGAAGGKRLGQKVEVDDLTFVTHDPLLAQLRYRLRKHHGAPREPNKRMRVTCVFSREAVARADAPQAGEVERNEPQVEDVATSQSDGSLNCAGYGSTVAVTATFGFCAAGWMLNTLAQSKTDI